MTFSTLTAISGLLLTTQALAADRIPYKEIVLDNKLSVITMESHKVPLVTIVLASRAGGITETPATNGLTHLWEHMFFKGNSRLPNQEAFNQRVRELGIVFNGDTSAEKVRYYFTLPSVFLDDGLQFMADAISTPLLEQTELEKERQVVLDEYDRNASQPGFDLYRLKSRILYGDQYYQRDALGERPIIAAATRQQLLTIKDEVFVPANSAILVAGDFDPATITARIKKYFAGWKNPPGWQPPKRPPLPAHPGNKEIIMTSERARTPGVTISWEGPRARRDPADTYAADVLISLLNLRTGRFYKKYMDSGLALGASLGYHTQAGAGQVVIHGSGKAENIRRIMQMLENEPKELLKKDYFTADQLEDVHRSLLVGYKFDVNKPSEYVKTLAFWWAITGLDYYRNYLENLRKTGLPEVRAFVKKYLVGKPRIKSWFLSPEAAKIAGLKDNSAELIAKHMPEKKK